MEYQVPQFIDVEDKIFGQLTFKQFIYVAGGIGLCVIIFLYLPRFLAILVCIPVASLSGALAFYKLNNKDFVQILEAGLKFYSTEKLYLWKKEEKLNVPKISTQAEVVAPREKLGLSANKLHDLAWSLDVKDRANNDASMK